MKPSKGATVAKAIIRIPKAYPHVRIKREAIEEPSITLPALSIPASTTTQAQVRAPIRKTFIINRAPIQKAMAMQPIVDLVSTEQSQGQTGEVVSIDRMNRFMDMFSVGNGVPVSQYLNTTEAPALAISAPELATTIKMLPKGLIKPRNELSVYLTIPRSTKFVEQLLNKDVFVLPEAGLRAGFYTTPEQLKGIKTMGKSFPKLRHDVAKQQYTGTFDMRRDLTHDQTDENQYIQIMLSNVLDTRNVFGRDLGSDGIREILWSFDANNPTILHNATRPKRFWESDDQLLRGDAPANMLRPPLFDFTFSYRKGSEMGVLIEQQKLEKRIIDFKNGSPVWGYIEWKP